MQTQQNSAFTNRTHADIELAKVYFEILVELAKSESHQTIEYGQLVDEARARHPGNRYVQGAIATNIGRRLDTLRDFGTAQGLPDLSALVVNKKTKDNGDGFKKSFDGTTVRAQIAAFDWNSVKLDFETFLAAEKEIIHKRESQSRSTRKIKEPEALNLLWEHYKEHRSDVGAVTEKEKEKVVELIMLGLDPAQAIEQVRIDR